MGLHGCESRPGNAVTCCSLLIICDSWSSVSSCPEAMTGRNWLQWPISVIQTHEYEWSVLETGR